MSLDYFYDGQLRRYMTQFLRIFLGWQYQSGTDANGNPVMRKIPAKMASRDKMVSSIIGNNSENTIQSVPQISCWIKDIATDRNRTQTPNHIGTLQIVEREIDPINNKYLETRGKSYTVERFMPVPYKLTMQTDIWTSNESQKHQIMEQILVLFNPSLDIQTGTNPIDWTALTLVELEDISWSSRGVPIGNSNEIEITSLTFNIPIWINPPSKVLKQTIVEQIITNINTFNEELIEANKDFDSSALYWSEQDMLSRIITTPDNHMIEVTSEGITLLNAHGNQFDATGDQHSWFFLLEKYGTFRPGISQIRLKTTDDIENYETDIVGTAEFDPNNTGRLLWTIDPLSLPQNTLPSVNGIINPLKTYPTHGLPNPTLGDRYLVLDDVNPSLIWGTIEAKAGDIIEYTPSGWSLMFDSSENDQIQYVVNDSTSVQLKWSNGDWDYSFMKKYQPGYWRIFL